MKKLIFLFAMAAGLAACGTRGERVTFDEVSFRGNAKAEERGEREVFLATVRGVSLSPEGAREAVRYEGTKYCIRWFGTSEIEWDIDPLAENLPVVDDVLTLRGRCVD